MPRVTIRDGANEFELEGSMRYAVLALVHHSTKTAVIDIASLPAELDPPTSSP